MSRRLVAVFVSRPEPIAKTWLHVEHRKRWRPSRPCPYFLVVPAQRGQFEWIIGDRRWLCHQRIPGSGPPALRYQHAPIGDAIALTSPVSIEWNSNTKLCNIDSMEEQADVALTATTLGVNRALKVENERLAGRIVELEADLKRWREGMTLVMPGIPGMELVLSPETYWRKYAEQAARIAELEAEILQHISLRNALSGELASTIAERDQQAAQRPEWLDKHGPGQILGSYDGTLLDEAVDYIRPLEAEREQQAARIAALENRCLVLQAYVDGNSHEGAKAAAAMLEQWCRSLTEEKPKRDEQAALIKELLEALTPYPCRCTCSRHLGSVDFCSPLYFQDAAVHPNRRWCARCAAIAKASRAATRCKAHCETYPQCLCGTDDLTGQHEATESVKAIT